MLERRSLKIRGCRVDRPGTGDSLESPVVLDLTRPFWGSMRSFRLTLAIGVVALSALAAPALASAADVYAGYSRIGSVRASYGGRYDVSQGYQRVGYVKASFGGRWDVYDGYTHVGYVKASYGGRWDMYSGYSHVGYAKAGYGGRWDVYFGYTSAGSVRGGPGAAAAGAALLLL
jgi:hypothetical protein